MRAIHGLTRNLNHSGRFKYKVRLSLLFLAHKTNKCSQEPDSIVDFLVIGAGALKLLWHLACQTHIVFYYRRSWACCRPAPFPEFSISTHLPSRETCTYGRRNEVYLVFYAFKSVGSRAGSVRGIQRSFTQVNYT